VGVVGSIGRPEDKSRRSWGNLSASKASVNVPQGQRRGPATGKGGEEEQLLGKWVGPNQLRDFVNSGEDREGQ